MAATDVDRANCLFVLLLYTLPPRARVVCCSFCYFNGSCGRSKGCEWWERRRTYCWYYSSSRIGGPASLNLNRPRPKQPSCFPRSDKCCSEQRQGSRLTWLEEWVSSSSRSSQRQQRQQQLSKWTQTVFQDLRHQFLFTKRFTCASYGHKFQKYGFNLWWNLKLFQISCKIKLK